jgi:hypothetical protein
MVAFMDARVEHPEFDRRRIGAAAVNLDKDRRLAERRCEVRERTLMAGRIIYNQGKSILDCQIRNFSEHGAKISVATAAKLPNKFKLDIPSRGRCYLADVRWRDRDSMGVQFCEPAAPPRPQSGLAGADLMRNLEQENATLRQRVLDLCRKLAEFGVSGESV